MNQKNSDKQNQQQLEATIDQAKRFESLAQHTEWAYFYNWILASAEKADRLLKHKDTRKDHMAMLEAVTKYEAYKGILDGFDKAIKDGSDARIKLREGPQRNR